MENMKPLRILMSVIRRILFLQCVILSVAFTQNAIPAEMKSGTIDGHPGWIMQGNIYEVNIRQYTREGTLKSFSSQLDRLKAMGVQTLWFMPLNPISVEGRKGSLG